ATPFGLVQLSPQTITGGDNGSGYSYEHTTIEGFALTQMSGVGWYGDLGNFLVMPTTGALHTAAGNPDKPDAGYRSRYDKQSEIAGAGYYAVQLADYSIRAEATAAPHSGMLRFTFPEHQQSRIQVDLARRVGGTSVFQELQVLDSITIAGSMRCTPDGGGWGNGDGHPSYTVYFYAQLSRPFAGRCGVWSADIPDGWSRKLGDVTSERYQERVAQSRVVRNVEACSGKHLGFFAEFDTQQDEQIILKAGISFASVDGARRSLMAEIPHWDFDAVREAGAALWNDALGKITVQGGTEEERIIFYTALYHTLLDPRYVSDIATPDDTMCDVRHPTIFKSSNPQISNSIFSGWDVFRSQMPLQTLINPELVSDLIGSLTTLAETSGRGYYERWEFLGAYSGCMVGNPAIAVLADAYAKNIRSFDVQKAWQVALHTSEKFGNGTLGYLPSERGYSISETLEYAYSDWCMAELAAALGKADDEHRFRLRAQLYKNIFDDSTGWFRPRKQSGEWEPMPPEGRLKEWYGCIESNPYQQGWFVPHDVDGMVELMGGNAAARKDLEAFFDSTPSSFLWNAYYNHANEPVHHVPFLFNRLGAPHLTQKWTRTICAKAYRNAVEGLVGNEDVGQMSAWYVLAAIGLHPLCPGEPRYEITSPLFDKITITLDPRYCSGKTFTIAAHNNSPKNIYIQRAALNGADYPHCYLDHFDIAAGGTLELWMGSEPPK
ncbi:MAG: GH92 family glycosyl hydrolase, partial [Prevotellaceae bacterium]|nr:GH92 family glycosyl hydrolase [Prevotellaceae bacterium]